MTHAQSIAFYVSCYPGLTRYGLMRRVRAGRASRNDYWYRACHRAIRLGLVRMDRRRRLWPTDNENPFTLMDRFAKGD